MNSQTPNLTKTPSSAKVMSSSLKERLRKLGRYHGTPPSTSTVSPLSATNTIPKEETQTPILDRSRLTQRRTNLSLKLKRKFSDEGEEDDGDKHELNATKERGKEEGNETKCKRRCVQTERIDGENMGEADVDRELTYIREQIEKRKEFLRKLKLVKVYRTKNDLNGLEDTIVKWREVCVEALKEFRDKSTIEPKPTYGELLDHLQIDHKLVRYDKEENSFN